MNDRYTGFPKGYEYLEKAFETFANRIEDIDYEIKNMPPDRGYTPQAPRPAGTPAPAPPIPREKLIANLSAEKEAIQSSMYKIADSAIANSDPAIAKEVKDKTQIMANPSIYKLSKTRFGEMVKDKADINHSQERASRFMNDHKYSSNKDEGREIKDTTLKGDIDKFFDDLAPDGDKQASNQEPEKTKEQKFAEMKDNKHGIEKDMEKFFNETSPQYVETRNDIVTKEPSFGPGEDN